MRSDQRLQVRMEEIPRQFFNGCHRKHSHPSKRVAQSIARQTGDGKAQPYKCRICKRWHNGHRYEDMSKTTQISDTALAAMTLESLRPYLPTVTDRSLVLLEDQGLILFPVIGKPAAQRAYLFSAPVGTAPLDWHQLPEPPLGSVAKHGEWLCTAIEFGGSEDAEQIARKLAAALERTA